MPLISVTDAGQTIPAGRRSQLILRNEGADDVRIGWETAVTNDATAETDGMLLKLDEVVAFGGADLDIGGALKLICASGETATVSYTERV